jgi:tyrosyl-tRNA synthetase
MYQYWLQTADADALRYLRMFTFLDRERIQELNREVETRPEKREAQRVLAAECTAIVCGEATVRAVEAVSRILFSSSNEIPAPETVALLSREVPVTEMTHRELDSGIGLVDLLVRAQLGESKGAARKLIEGGGVYINNHRQNDARAVTYRRPRSAVAVLNAAEYSERIEALLLDGLRLSTLLRQPVDCPRRNRRLRS